MVKRFEPRRVRELNVTLGAVRILDRVFTKYGNKAALLSSFGIESGVLLNMISLMAPETPIVFIDTGLHFPETLEYRDTLIKHFGLTNVIEISAKGKVDPLPNPVDNHDVCCYARKTKIFKDFSPRFDVYISGLRREQTRHRDTVKVVEVRDSIMRVYPILSMMFEDVINYLIWNRIPMHPLYEKGYQSVGCFPCTDPGKDREGRWSGTSKTECGLHL